MSDALLVTDDSYLPVFMRLLQSASKSIDIISYSYSYSYSYSFAIGSASGVLSKKVRRLKSLRSSPAKGFCIDSHYVLFGSTNLTNQSIKKNNETNLVLNDRKVVKGFEAYFSHLWNGGRHGEIKLKPPLYADGDFKNQLIDIIESAKKRLEFSIYFFHYTEVEQAFIAAHKRGVKVRGFVHDHNAFAMSYVRRTRATVGRLKEAGIKDLGLHH